MPLSLNLLSVLKAVLENIALQAMIASDNYQSTILLGKADTLTKTELTSFKEKVCRSPRIDINLIKF